MGAEALRTSLIVISKEKLNMCKHIEMEYFINILLYPCVFIQLVSLKKFLDS